MNIYWQTLNNYCTKIILFSFFNLHNGNKKAKWTFSTQMWQMGAATMLIDIWHSSVNVVTLIFEGKWNNWLRGRINLRGLYFVHYKANTFLPANNTSLAHVSKCQMWNSHSGLTLWVMVKYQTSRVPFINTMRPSSFKQWYSWDPCDLQHGAKGALLVFACLCLSMQCLKLTGSV